MDRTAEMNALFDRIAPSYDRVTRIISLGLDRRWRAASIAELGRTAIRPRRILDACCGTGEYSFLLGRAFPEASISAVDFSRPMLRLARRKAAELMSPRIEFVVGDLNRLPFRDMSFDLATVAFGLRNSVSFGRSVHELGRVLKPGGLLFIVEFATPGKSLFDRVFKVYFHLWVPFVGWVFGRSFGQYAHLPKSVERFGRSERLAGELERLGFDPVTVRPLFRDIIFQYCAWKKSQ